MNKVGMLLADREYIIIVNGMKTCAGNTINAKQKGQLSKDDIREAQSQAEDYADSIIMSNIQEIEFWKNEQIFEPVLSCRRL